MPANDSLVVNVYHRSGSDNRRNGRAYNYLRASFSFGLCVDWWGLYVGKCCRRSNMGEDIRYLGAKANLADRGGDVFLLVNHLR